MTIKEIITTILGAKANFLSINHWKATVTRLKLTGVLAQLLCLIKDLNTSRNARMFLHLKPQPEPTQLEFPWKALA